MVDSKIFLRGAVFFNIALGVLGIIAVIIWTASTRYYGRIGEDIVLTMVAVIGFVLLQCVALLGLLTLAKLLEELPKYQAFFFSALINASVGAALIFCLVLSFLNPARSAYPGLIALFVLFFLAYYAACYASGVFLDYMTSFGKSKKAKK